MVNLFNLRFAPESLKASLRQEERTRKDLSIGEEIDWIGIKLITVFPFELS